MTQEMGKNMDIETAKGVILLDNEARFTYRDREGRTLHVFPANGGVVLHMTDTNADDTAVFVEADCAEFLVQAFQRISGFAKVNA